MGRSQSSPTRQHETNGTRTSTTWSETRSTLPSRDASTSTEAYTHASHPMSTTKAALEADSRSKETRSTSSGTSKTAGSTDYISDKDLYQLLAMIVKLSESQASKTSFVCSIVDYVSSKLNRSSEDINHGIQYYATESIGPDRHSSSIKTKSS